jgi:hypothetical protein
MEMGVKDRLPGSRTSIEYQPVVRQTFGCSHLTRRSEQGPGQLRIVLCRRGRIRLMGRGDDQDMGWRYRRNVAKRDNVVGTVHNVGGDIPRHDSAEQAVRHASSSHCPTV